MSRDYTLEQVTEMALQAEIVCRMWEDHPHTMTETEVSAIATLVKRLSGRVYCWLNDELAEKECGK
ncbi:hypothetical protein [Tatumella terrea]|uniref:Uncharacterized protein n=1 Tax=Tatumella terrea TaxID=419007 RepID=A0ABW1W1E9_9GAMM